MVSSGMCAHSCTLAWTGNRPAQTPETFTPSAHSPIGSTTLNQSELKPRIDLKGFFVLFRQLGLNRRINDGMNNLAEA